MIFDRDDGDFLFGSGSHRYDSEGHMMRHMGGNRAMDMETGEIHRVRGWEEEEEEEEDDDDW